MLLSVFTAHIRSRSAPPIPGLRIRYITKNPSIFKSVFEAQKTRKAAPKAPKKRQKSTPKYIKTISAKSRFLQYVPYESLDFGSPKRRNFDSEIDRK